MNYYYRFILFFFYQAEDGIRDGTATGLQTCALPIWLAWDCFENQGLVLPSALELGRGGRTLKDVGYDADITAAAEVDVFAIVPELKRDPLRIEIEIGRASCRERV